jgi:hypothetical protein
MADKHYEAEVNTGEFSVRQFEDNLNNRHEDGWQLAFAFTHQNNAIVVWERQAGSR